MNIRRLLALVTLSALACGRESAQPIDAPPKSAEQRTPPVPLVVADAPQGLPPHFARDPGPCVGEMHEPFDYAGESRFVVERSRFAGDSTVARASETLRIQVRAGLTLIFRDCRADDGAMNVRYVYRGRGPNARGHLIERGFYEGGGWLWVSDSTGQETSFAAEPLFSQDSAHFAVANVDLEAGYTANVFEVWSVRGSEVSRVATVPLAENTGARNATWRDAANLRAERVELDGGGNEVVRMVLLARNRNGRWTVDSAPP